MTGFLDRARLCRAVDGTLWDSLSVVDETASTNADAAAAARSGAPQGYVRVSCHQSAGKGRFDRTWTAPPGTSVAVSALVRPGRRDADWGWLSLLVGVAVIGKKDDLGVRWSGENGRKPLQSASIRHPGIEEHHVISVVSGLP